MLKNMSTQNPEVLENMGFDEEKANQNICVSDHVYGSDSFVVDMECFSHDLIHQKDIINGNSKITRNVSRKGCLKNINTTAVHQISKGSTLPDGSSCTPEKPLVGTTKIHHNQIVINNTKQFGGRGHPAAFTCSIHPRRILIFFATLSSMGTILLIYFTLSIGGNL